MIDTSTWKEFKISDIGFKNFHGIRQKQSDRIEGDTPLLTAGKENQGVASYIGNPPSTYIDSITVDMFGNSFFHKGVYAGDDNIYFFVNDNVSDEAKLFIATIINTDNTPKYAFKDQFRQPQADALSVHLPATPDGQPDWDYMESYMKAVMEESEKSLENLKRTDDTKHLIDASEWGKFSCKELFECKNTGNILARDVIDGSGDTPYVTASGYNNGVVAHIDASNYEIIKGHCILVGGKTFTITYQKDDFVSNDSHNFTIRVKDCDISDLDYLYLASMIYTYFGQKYSWNDAVTKDKLLDESIPLPITSTGEPDWQYMEDYMKQIMDKSEQIISDLQIGA